MGELIQLMHGAHKPWPKLAAGARRHTLRIRHGHERHLPGGGLAICYSTGGKPQLMLLNPAFSGLKQRSVRLGTVIKIDQGVTLQVVASAVPDTLLLVIQDSRPQGIVEAGDFA